MRRGFRSSTGSTSCTPGRCRARSHRCRSRAPRAATSGTTTATATSTSPRRSSTLNLGHQHPKVVAAIKEQAEKLATIGPPMAHETRSELARLLAEVTPGDLDMTFFTNGGAEANENADQAGALGHRAPQDRRPLPLATTARRQARSRSPATRGAGRPSRASPASCACSTRTRTAARPAHPAMPCAGLLAGGAASRGDPAVRGAADRRGRHHGDGRPAPTASSSRPPATCSRSARSATATASCSSSTR